MEARIDRTKNVFILNPEGNGKKNSSGYRRASKHIVATVMMNSLGFLLIVSKEYS
jgi:hypothetical protein